MPATLERTTGKKIRSRVRESAQILPGASNVDREAGVIRGVKILGLSSPNTHGVPGAKSSRYTKEALRAAKTLYENADVFLNHRERNSRNTDDDADGKLGILRDVREGADGLYADYHFLKAKKFNECIVEDAERGLGMYSFSHDANGEGDVTADGVFTITRIVEVRRVDIVAKGATNKNLFESQQKRTTPMAKTFRRSLRERWFDGGLSATRQAWLTRLLEMDFMKDDKPLKEEDPMPLGATELPPEAAAPDAAPEDALMMGFETALHALATSALKGEMDEAAAITKFKELLKAYGKITGTAEPEAPPASTETVTEESEEEDKEKDKGKEVAESLKRIADLESKLAVVTLCESKKFAPTPLERAALEGLPEGKRLAFIVEAMAGKNRPKSASPHGNTTAEQTEVKFPTTPEARKRLTSLR